jgi:hypothetical protein
MHGFTIGNPKYLGGFGGPAALGGSKPPPFGLMVDYQKLCSPLWAYFHANSQNFYSPWSLWFRSNTPSIIWISVDTNGTSIIIIIGWALA